MQKDKVMGQISAKLRSIRTNLGNGVSFWCPGCEEMHAVTIGGPHAWGFDGNLTAPTFTPSILVNGFERLTDEQHAQLMARTSIRIDRSKKVCHSLVSAGSIQFLGDCTHKLAGQTVDMPDLPAWATDQAATAE